MNLLEIFLAHKGLEIYKWVNYFPAYERHLSSFRNKHILFLEIGCGGGGSLQMWSKYFGPQATIVGIDIRPECAIDYEEKNIHVRIGDQSSPDFLNSLIKEFGSPDAILDDGSHMAYPTNASFDVLYPQLSSTGVYIVEDLHTAYWPEFQGGLCAPGTFIERCKSLIDELNSEHSRGVIPSSVFSKTTLSIHIYDSMAVFEKGSSAKYAQRVS